jgi:hypothetical protein
MKKKWLKGSTNSFKEREPPVFVSCLFACFIISLHHPDPLQFLNSRLNEFFTQGSYDFYSSLAIFSLGYYADRNPLWHHLCTFPKIEEGCSPRFVDANVINWVFHPLSTLWCSHNKMLVVVLALVNAILINN